MQRKIYLLGIIILLAGVYPCGSRDKNVPKGHAHNAVYDGSRKQMVVFGGSEHSGKSFSDIWTFDIESKTWEKVEVEKTPLARQLSSAAYDSSKKQIIIFGGRTKKKYLSDTWVFDIEKKLWEEIITENSPPARQSHSAVYDSANKQMIVFGGTGGPGYSDTWAFDTEKRKWEKIETEGAPSARFAHTAVYIEDKNQMIIFGGMGSAKLADTWIYDISNKKWEEVKTENAPEEREYHSAVYDSDHKQMLIFGGFTQTVPLYSLWVYDTEKKTWEEIETDKYPSARGEQPAIYDSVGKQMLIFGGFGSKEYSDVWAFHTDKKEWSKIK